jgi:predicted dienelactone hydrolase
LTFGVGLTLASPALAAERVAVRLGPLETSIAIADLESFANSGKVPDSLTLYRPLLTPEVRRFLRGRLRLDPNVGDKLVEDLLYSAAGERFLNTLQGAIPGSNAHQLRQAIGRAAKKTDGISLLGFLRAFPSQTVTIDAPSVLALASQMNAPQWQSQALGSMLEQELTVKNKPVNLSFDPTQPGSDLVQMDTVVMRDYERDRIIPADIYWSKQTTAGPLVVLSHGFGADRRFLRYLAEHLASYGLTVVALEHPGSNVAWLTSNVYSLGDHQTSSILPANEFIDRPKDVSFLLDRLSTLNRFSQIFRGKFNTDNVTLIGHSLGGYTALTLAGANLSLKHLQEFCADPTPVVFSPADLLQCNAADLKETPASLRDPRVKQAIVLNPLMGRLFDQKSLAQVAIPTLMVAATNDTITPAVSQQFLPFTQMSSSKLMLTAIGATHLSVGDPTNLNHALTQSIFIRERTDRETEGLRALLRGVSLAFIKQQSPEAEQYRPFLSSAYAQSFSTTDLQLRLNAELPPNFASWLKMSALPMEQLVARSLSGMDGDVTGSCETAIGCLQKSLPLVMFILPGGMPLARQFFKFGQDLPRRRRRRRKK